MSLPIGLVLLSVLLISGGHWLTRTALGSFTANRNLRYVLPWLLLGMLVPLVISLLDSYALNVLYALYAVTVLLWLLSWPLRSRKAGDLLFNAGRTWNNKLLFWIGSLEVGVAAVITWVSLIAIADLPDTPEPMAQLSKVLFWWTFAVFLLSVGLNRLELRENGMCFLYTFVPWRRMKAYTWETSAPNTLTVRIKPRLPLLSGYMSIRVPKSCRDDVDQVLQTHVPISDAS